MATSKALFIFLMLALQLLCSSLLAHALPTSEHSSRGHNVTVIPHQFFAYLAENYTLDSHWQRIGVELNITQYYKNLGCYYIDFSNDTITHNLSESSTLALIRSDPNIDHVAPNEIFPMVTSVTHNITSVTQQENEARIARVANNTSRVDHFNTSRVDHFNIYEQMDAPWHLKQISDIQKYSRETSYYYLASGGYGVTVYVMDTGLDRTVKRWHADRFHDAPYGYVNDELVEEDFNGHGTHVASLIGSRVFGVAKSCTIMNVKVADQNREISVGTFHLAVNWIVDNYEEIKQKPGFKGAIINMSLAIKYAPEAVRLAVIRADKAGIVIVNAAGKDSSNIDDLNLYPAESWRTITVGGSLQNYEWLQSSNYGAAVDIIAPGGGVESYSRDGDILVASGTSMATALVSGVIALWMGHEGPMNRETAKQRLWQNADNDYIIALPPDTKDRSLNWGYLKGWVGWPYAGAPFY